MQEDAVRGPGTALLTPKVPGLTLVERLGFNGRERACPPAAAGLDSTRPFAPAEQAVGDDRFRLSSMLAAPRSKQAANRRFLKAG